MTGGALADIPTAGTDKGNVAQISNIYAQDGAEH
jgi:hypothetical protein